MKYCQTGKTHRTDPMNFIFQEQPLLLEDLLEQEKREQARHSSTNPTEQQMLPNQNQQSILNDMVSCRFFFKLEF